MNITKIIIISLACLIIIILLRKVNSDYAFFASSVINIGITVFSLTILGPLFEYILAFANDGIYSDAVKIMFKSAGVCLMASLSSELCRDAGENSLSSRIELAAKCTLLTFCLPLVQKVLEYAKMFLD